MMGLEPEDIRTIRDLVADPIDKANRESMARLERDSREAMQRLQDNNCESMERIEKMLSDHVEEHNALLRDHERRLAWLEKMFARAIAAWTVIVACATFLASWIWKTWLEPLIKGRGHP